MAVFRVEKTRNYTVMSNHHLRDKSLSLKAKGLLSLMLSLPEDWDYTTRGLAYICKDGVDSICATVRELEGLMLDTVCSTKPTLRVAGEDLPAEVVRSRLLKLTGAHLLYVLDRIRENTTDVRHVKPYLLTALYNAPLTMDNHYALMVGHDLSGGSG